MVFMASLFPHKFLLVDCNLYGRFLSYDTCSKITKIGSGSCLFLRPKNLRHAFRGSLNKQTKIATESDEDSPVISTNEQKEMQQGKHEFKTHQTLK